MGAFLLVMLSSPGCAHTGANTDRGVGGSGPPPTSGASGPASQDTSARPFRVNIPEAELDDLRRRIQSTRWPDMETVPDQSQGVQLAKLQELVRY
jgi:hypothetical protein